MPGSDPAGLMPSILPLSLCVREKCRIQTYLGGMEPGWYILSALSSFLQEQMAREGEALSPSSSTGTEFIRAERYIAFRGEAPQGQYSTGRLFC